MKVPAVSRSADPLDALGERIENISGLDPATTSREERKQITKEAMREVINEWLDERYRSVGKWSLRGIALAAFGALFYFILTHTGWSR